MERKLEIVSFVNKNDRDIIDKLKIEWEKYFKFNNIFIDNNKNSNLDKSNIDILFISGKNFSQITNQEIQSLKGINRSFMFVVFADKMIETDDEYLKNHVDHMIYLDQPFNLIKWNSIAVLRRYWNTYSKSSTIFYKNFIFDFIEGVVTVDKKKIDFTSKEIDLMKVFVKNIGKYIKREELSKKVWGINDDNTRVLNQILFKVKNKLGYEYFETKRKEGVKFE